MQWPHRDPAVLAHDIARLHSDPGREIFAFCDENSRAGHKPRHASIEALIAWNISVMLLGSPQVDDIVRDAYSLHLYKQAGFKRFLIERENTDEAVLKLIRKGGARASHCKVIRLLRQHDILSVVTLTAWSDDYTDADLFPALRQLVCCDANQI